MDWTSIYQNQFMQIQNMNNQMNNMNNMIFNNPLDQIQFMATQNNGPQMMGGNQNFNASNEFSALNNEQDYKINLIFTTLKGAKINMFVDCNETIEGIITKFLKRVNLENLIGNLDNKLKFILSAENMEYGDKRKIKDVLLGGTTMSNVFVHDTGNLIGAQ